MRVLHATLGAVDAVLAGCPILPVEGLVCPNPACRDGYQIDGSGEPVGWCPVCESGVVPPVLSGRIAVAAPCPPAGTSERYGLAACTTCDGLGALIVGTATATDVLPVNKESTEALARFLPALGLSPGQWVVTIEDWAPTTDRCPRCWGAEHLPCTDPMCEPDDGDSHVHWVTCPTCDGVGSCPPVPVAAAPDGTITTWEAT